MRPIFALAFVGCTSDHVANPDPPGTVNPPKRYDHDGAARNPSSIPPADAAHEEDAGFDAGRCVAQCTTESDGGTPEACAAIGGHCGDSPVLGGPDGGDGFLPCCLR